MNRFWNRLTYETRYQLYCRVLPVILLAVVLTGGLSWLVLNRQATAVVSARQPLEIEGIATMLRQSALQEVLVRAAQPGCSGAVYGGVQVCANDELHWAVNDRRVEAWLAANNYYFHSEFKPATWSGTRSPESPVQIVLSSGQTVLLFPPVLLKSEGATEAAYLPTVVREPVSGSGGGEMPGAILHLLAMTRLAETVRVPGNWLLLGADKQLVYSTTGYPAVGVLLAHASRAERSNGVLACASGPEIVAMAQSRHEVSQGEFGGMLRPHLLAGFSSDELPMTIVHAVSPEPLGTASGLFAVTLLAVALVASIFVTWGIGRVMARATRRLIRLAANMGSVAKGNYTRRMDAGADDDLGRVISYFNTMAVGLEESQRQVKDKAAHLKAALDNMRMLDRAKDDFLVLISHEVRTPLTAIMGGVDYLKSSLEKIDGPDREVIERLNVSEIASIIESSGERLTGFMNDAIQMTTIQSSDRKLDLRPVAAAELVELGLCGVREQASRARISVENELDDDADWCVLCDPDVLKVAFEKILANAVTHNIAGGSIRITEARRVPGEGEAAELTGADNVGRLCDQPSFRQWEDEEIRWRLIEVFNTGEAIPAGRQKALFGKFELVGRIEHHQKGSGLSLPIAKSAVEHHGGLIFLHSGQADGNSFYVLLPTVDASVGHDHQPSSRLWDDVAESIGGAAGHEEIGEVAYTAAFEIELDDLGPGGLCTVHEPGSGIDGSGSAHDEKEVTAGCRSG